MFIGSESVDVLVALPVAILPPLLLRFIGAAIATRVRTPTRPAPHAVPESLGDVYIGDESIVWETKFEARRWI